MSDDYLNTRRGAEALAYHLERHFGAKVAQCPRCRSHDLYENHRRACWHCDGCDYDISDRFVLWVPKDERARRPEEQPVDSSLTQMKAGE